MPDLRVDIQRKIMQAVIAGSFYEVRYNDVTHLPIDIGTTKIVPGSVICNEVAAGILFSSTHGAREPVGSLDNWQFNCTFEFNKEVTTYKFLTEELQPIRFTSEDKTRAEIKFGSYSVSHPARQGANSGTQVELGITVTLSK
jgi:hypothetical protein